MTQKHTQEPWVLFEVGDRVKHFCPASEKEKTSILTVTLEDGTAFGAVYSEEDARRIVACVNACAGWETSPLEAMELGSLKESLVRVMQQRDELLAALEALDDCYSDTSRNDLTRSELQYHKAVRADVADIIAKAKVGATITKTTGETK